MPAGSVFGDLLGLLYDVFFANIIRFVGNIALPRRDRGRLSAGFVATLLVLLAYGLVVLFSASYATGYSKTGDLYQYIRPQLAVAVIGLVLMYAVSFLNYRSLQYAHWPLYLLTILLLIWALFSEEYNGAHRWIFLFGSVTVQPSEIAKFSAILCVATAMNKNFERRNKFLYGVILPVLPLALYILLLLLEPHHSAIILMGAIVITMLLCGGANIPEILLSAGAVGIVAWKYMTADENQWASSRMSGAWGLFAADTSEMGWQMQQSIYSISSGGLTGLGLGNSRQKHQWLPESVNDFIFPVLCEELGFIGGVVCMLLFALFIVQGILIALRAPDYFGSMVGIGITAQIAWQVFCHIGVVTGVLPNTGISLPFFSSGGTSLLLLLAEMGVLLSISRAGNAKLARQQRAERRPAYTRGGRAAK